MKRKFTKIVYLLLGLLLPLEGIKQIGEQISSMTKRGILLHLKGLITCILLCILSYYSYIIITNSYVQSVSTLDNTLASNQFALIFAGGSAMLLCFILLFVVIIGKNAVINMFLGDQSSSAIIASIENGRWQQDYQSKYNSLGSFILFDPIGQRVKYYKVSPYMALEAMVLIVGGCSNLLQKNDWQKHPKFSDIEVLTTKPYHYEYRYCG